MTARAPVPSLSAPSAALLLTALGSGVILGARSRAAASSSPVALLAGLAFVGLAAHRPIAQALRKAGTRRRAADVLVSFVVDRPVEQVFAFCADFENYPRFIRSLRQVRDNGDGHSHWSAWTPAGNTVEWDAVTTKYVTNSVIGWRSVAGSPIETTGLIRFSNEGGRTCVRVALHTRVLDGSLRDAVAALAKRSTADEFERDIALIGDHIARSEPAEPVGESMIKLADHVG